MIYGSAGLGVAEDLTDLLDNEFAFNDKSSAIPQIHNNMKLFPEESS